MSKQFFINLRVLICHTPVFQNYWSTFLATTCAFAISDNVIPFAGRNLNPEPSATKTFLVPFNLPDEDSVKGCSLLSKQSGPA